MPKGRLGLWVCKEIQFKERGGVPPLLSWMTQDACLERRGTAQLTNIPGQDRGHASTGPSLLSSSGADH